MMLQETKSIYKNQLYFYNKQSKYEIKKQFHF